jgi:endo-1,3-1,4-beta-glycanase ExoK
MKNAVNFADLARRGVPSLSACCALLGAVAVVGCDAGRESLATGGIPAGAAGSAIGGSGANGVAGATGDVSTDGGGVATNGGLPGAGGSGGVPSAAGAGASGGASAGASAGAGGALASGGSDSSFTLAWGDDFDTLDTSAWQLESFTYDGNQAVFSPDNAKVAGGTLTISLSAAAAGAAKPYLGVEMRSVKTLTYGKVSARMRFATGSGVVSGLVLFYTPFPNCDWNEIDIEHLGKTNNVSQLNAMVYTGTPVANCTASVTPTQQPLLADLGFNAETDYHLYDIEWTPAGVRYLADGVLLRTWTTNISRLKLPQNILLTIWASSAPDWAGALTPASAPTSADIDWIKVYDWNG